MDLMGTFFSRAANCSLESTTAKIIFKKKKKNTCFISMDLERKPLDGTMMAENYVQI